MPIIATISDDRLSRPVEQFFQRPDIHANLSLLARCLPASAQILVAGGALRNIVIDIIHGSAPPTRDIDIFIGGLDPAFSLAAVLGDQRIEPSDLKGLHWYPASSDLVYDMCLLPDFLVIAIGHLDPTLENFLTGIDFTVNAILYDFKQRALFERGCTAAVSGRMLDFNSRIIPDKRLMAYRILLTAHKTGFSLSKPVFQFVRNRLELETLTYVKRLLRAKIGKIGEANVMETYECLCRFRSHDAYLSNLYVVQQLSTN